MQYKGQNSRFRNFAKFADSEFSQKFRKIHRPQAYNFIKKETLAQMISCEFCEIFKNAYFY